MQTPSKKRPAVNGAENGAPGAEKEAGSIQVVIRLRPMNDREKEFGTLPVVTASTNERSVTVIKDKNQRKQRLKYSFDNVFTAFSTQEEVFDQTLKPVFDDVLDGFESTIFAYGQTGTGKTHTMEGDLSSEEDYGVIPRSAVAIFERLHDESYTEHKVFCSYLEIYNEELADLLAEETNTNGVKSSPKSKRSAKLEILGGKNGPFVRGLTEKVVDAPDDVLAFMNMAQTQRRIGETSMNKQSSRSHCIFTLRISAKRQLPDGSGVMEFNGKLHMVDLAGSECAKSANLNKGGGNTAPTRERERMNINRSLLTLGRVISMLKERSQAGNKKNVRIPYRDSKLTRLLQESLGGRCKAVIIATLSPSITAIEESISTLNYAQSANQIVNKPIAKSYLSMNSITGTPGKQFDGGDGQQLYKSVDDWNELEIRLQYMQAQVEEAQSALARKHGLQQEAEERAEMALEKVEKMELVIEQQRDEIESLNSHLGKEISQRESTEAVLAETKAQLTSQTTRAENAEENCQSLEEKLKYANGKIDSLTGKLAEEIRLKEDALTRLRDTSIDLKKIRAVLSLTQRTESVLTSEATTLIGTLKNAIADGDSLHSLVEQFRSEDVERRASTRNYCDAESKVLEGIIATLLSLSESATQLCKKMEDEAEKNYSEGQNSMEQTTNLFKEMSADVSELTSTIRNQLVSAGGIVPTVSATTSYCLAGLDHMEKIVTEGEDELSTAFDFLRSRLEDHSTEVERLWTVHDASTESSLSTLKTSVESSKEKLRNMMKSSNETLSSVKRVQSERREAQSALIAKWEKSTLETSENMKDVANNSCNALAESLGIFKDEMKNIDEVDDFLARQHSFLIRSGDAHKMEISEQQKTLEEQRVSHANDREKVNVMRETFVNNLMNGVQSLLSEQMLLIKTDDLRHFDFCDKSNKELSEHNHTLAKSANNILTEVSNVNTSLTNKALSIRKNNTETAGAMDDARKTLADLSNTSQAHAVSVSSFVRQAVDNVALLSKLDLETDELKNKISNHGKDCVNHLEEEILVKTNDSMQILSTRAGEIAHHGNAVVQPEVSALLNGMQTPRCEIIDNFEAARVKNAERLNVGQSEIESISEKQSATNDEIRAYVRAKEDIYGSNVAKLHASEIEQYKKNLLSQTMEYETSTTGELSGCSKTTSSVKAKLEEFIVNTIKARTDVDPVAARLKFEYEETLTSTPEESVICQDLNFEKEMAIVVTMA